ncbi:uncharacterized protein TNCV_2735601 [Trichonephila clavipes]|nr:uncharacterized protein TNCV_2735601 [Trichonephila clavipes]
MNSIAAWLPKIAFPTDTLAIVRVHYFVRGGFVRHRSRASSKHLSSHLPVDGARYLGGQKGVALQVQDARVGVGSTKKPTPLDVDVRRSDVTAFRDFLKRGHPQFTAGDLSYLASFVHRWAGEVPKEAELTDFEMRCLEDPILTLPLSTPFDSDSTDVEISKPQYPSTSTPALLIPPVNPSQNTDKITEYDSSSDPSNAVMDMNDLKPTPKIARPLKETLAMFRKHAKTPTAPSAAARAAACIEEHQIHRDGRGKEK